MEEVRVPLLASQDSCLQEDSEDDIMIRYSARDTGKKAWGCGQGEKGIMRGGEPEVSKTRRKKQQYSGSEMMVAVFVVAFDTKKGEGIDTMVWCGFYIGSLPPPLQGMLWSGNTLLKWCWRGLSSNPWQVAFIRSQRISCEWKIDTHLISPSL